MVFDRVKVFSATKARERGALGEVVTAYLKQLPEGTEVVDCKVVQSSDNEFHCLSVVLLLRYPVT